MKVTYFKPAAMIAPCVKAIMVIENERITDKFALPLFANGTPTLLFTTATGNLGGNNRHLTLFGQTTQPKQLLINNNFELIAYFLQPYALGSLFHISAAELTDKPIELNLLTRKTELQERLLNTANTGQRLQLIDNYFYNKIAAIKGEDKRMIYAANQISGLPNKNILKIVQQELHMTERTFERQFEQNIGVSPNLFRRINQFNRAFGQINTSDYHDFSMIAYQNGYADQSHLIRSFKEFTGITPTGYLSARPGA